MSKQTGADEPPKRAKRARAGSKGTAPTDAQTVTRTGIGSGSGGDRESSVADYLRAHPDFFECHPEILALMHIRHDTGGAVSLIERQVGALRRQLDTERGRLAHLISRAREYETLATRHHDLVLHLIPAVDLDALRAVLHDGLKRELGAEAVALKLFPVDDPESDAGRPDPLVAAFRDFLDRPHALCGPLDPAQGAILFGEPGTGLQSAVLVPIRAGHRCGVLAIGAADRERFGPEMRTDLLDRLGEIVSAKLRTLPGEPAVAAPPEPKPRPASKRAPRAKAPKPAAAETLGQTKPRSKRAPVEDSAPAPKPAPRRTAGRSTKPKTSRQSPEEPLPDPNAQTASE